MAKGNITSDDAHTKAGYKKNRKNATRLKTTQDIQARIAELQGRVADKMIIDKAWVTNNLVRAADLSLRTKVDAAGVSHPEPTYNAPAAVSAIKLVGQTLNAFVERHEHTGKDGAAIQVEEEITVDERSKIDIARKVVHLLRSGKKK